MGWIIYLLYFPIGFAITAYLTWLILGIIDSFIDDSSKKNGRTRQYSSFGADLFVYVIIFFTNIFSVKIILDTPYTNLQLPPDIGWLGSLVLLVVSVCIIRFAAYAIDPNNITGTLKKIFFSRYAYFTKCLVLLDFGYISLNYSGTDEFMSLLYGCISWLILIFITIFVGIFFNDKSDDKRAISDSNHYRSPAIVLIPFLIIFIIIFAIMAYDC